MIVNRSAPGATVVPILIYDDVAKALDWLHGAFGFVERLRAPGRDGAINHAQIMAGAGAIIVGRAGGPFKAPSGAGVSQYVVMDVDDVDRHFAHASAFGARIVQPPEDLPFGCRQYTAADLAGHWWTFSQNIADVPPSAWGAILKS
jgi:uncharacterized glyoxalase superfamily protein PhnB